MVAVMKAFSMLSILLNVVVCLSLTEINSATISDFGKDSSTNNHDKIKHLYDKNLNVVVNTNQNSLLNELFVRAATKMPAKQSIMTAMNKQNMISDKAANLTWDAEKKLLETSLLKLNRQHEENKCLLDSLKLALLWWCHRNGTVREKKFPNLRRKQLLDLSYHNIISDEEASNLLAKYLRNREYITSTMRAFSLAYNNLTAVPFHTLQRMASSLKYLSLKGNPFVALKVSAAGENSSHCILNRNDLKLFRNHNATRLFVANWNQLAWAKFPYMPTLIELDISDCGIEYIAKEAFQNLTNLKNLYMSHNKILNIPADTFSYTPYLQVLDLSFANVPDAQINTIMKSPNFESILKWYYGVNIEQQFFNYLPNLVYLDLSHTKLRGRSAVAFSYTSPTLKYLSLCYTSFPVFGNGIFKSSALIGLDLSGNANAAFSLDENVFANLAESLNYLFFENAHLRDLSWLRPLKNLRFLALAGNSINNLLAQDFMALKELQILDLSSNHVNNWYSRVFQHNENLRILSLRHNNINFISSAMLTDLSTVIFLSLGSNNFICDCILHDLVDVSSLNNQCAGNFSQVIKNSIHINSDYLAEIFQNSKLFYNNHLSGLDIPSLIVSQNLYKFKEIVKKITQSPQLKGNSKLQFILKTLNSQNNANACQQQHNSSSIYLSRKFNNSILKFQLLDYREEQYWCYNQSRKENLRRLNCQRSYLIENIEQELTTLTAYVLGSVGSFLLIALIGLLLYVKRWHIYYYYSSLKSAALLSVVCKEKHKNFKNLCDQNSNMIYDIFISYCQSDRDWIVSELVPNIEETADISICLHERDFQVGVTILDNIVSSMERSKAMMLIISSNFLLSHWCQFEMQLAHHHILDLNKDNLIVVFLEDIPRSKRPKNLQFLMNVKTYIKWPGGKCEPNVHTEERKLFWKRLKHSLRNKGLNFSESKA